MAAFREVSPTSSAKHQAGRLRSKYAYIATKNGVKIIIGRYGTTINFESLLKLDYTLNPVALAEHIIVEVFGHETLATHTLNGEIIPPSFDYKGPDKGTLDLRKVADVVEFMKFNRSISTREVGIAIIVKCAVECKLKRRREGSLH